MFENILKNGIYFIQIDARKDGVYTHDPSGNLVRHDYKITFIDKLNFLFFNKAPNSPIATRFLLFIYYCGNPSIFYGTHSGDAISVAKDVKNRYRYLPQQNFKQLDNMIQIDSGGRFQELTFNEIGQNIKSVIKIKEINKVEIGQNYSFISWDVL